jgi:hypothetical protein
MERTNGKCLRSRSRILRSPANSVIAFFLDP